MVAKSVGLGDSVMFSVARTVKIMHVIETTDLVPSAVLMDIQDPFAVKVGTLCCYFVSDIQSNTNYSAENSKHFELSVA